MKDTGNISLRKAIDSASSCCLPERFWCYQTRLGSCFQLVQTCRKTVSMPQIKRFGGVFQLHNAL